MRMVQDLTQGDVLDARALLQRAGVDVGMSVADMGTGREGSFVTAAAQLVTSTGTVYALDVVKDILTLVQERAEAAGLHNVVPIWTDLEMYGATRRIVDGMLDVGIVANTLFQSEKRDDMIAECVRMIKPGGTLLVVDWKTSPTPMGPPLEHRVDPEEIKRSAQRHELHLAEEFEAGEYHWGLLFKK